ATTTQADHTEQIVACEHFRFTPKKLPEMLQCRARGKGASSGPELPQQNSLQDYYSITSSARESSEGEIVSQSALAVLRLITSSNFVGCSTGRSAALAPLRILSTYAALRR